ncbi:MAG: sugar transferase [Alphaproteobacteria bacterium]|nr:sugar transferase [Alphaproteobacteria bacterium]
MKRVFDFTVAFFGLFAASPIILGTLIAVKLTSPGPALFRQTRVGRNEVPFTCFKLRTMYDGTRDLPSHVAGSSPITPLGHFLRKTKLDELPQLWNIILGDMSFVGPRPCLPIQTELVERRRDHGLYRIRPGITGVSQVQGVDMSDAKKLADLDATYLDDMSLATDIRLIVRTVTGAGQGDPANNA